MPDPSLLLLIPAYNEERRIEPVLRDYAHFFQDNYHGKFQLVVVLNGCTDDTIGVVRRMAAEFLTIRALEFKAPIGKGGALIEELMAHATQRQFVYTHRWRVGDLVMWDNLSTMHRATPFEDIKYKRDMRRVTVLEREMAD